MVTVASSNYNIQSQCQRLIYLSLAANPHWQYQRVAALFKTINCRGDQYLEVCEHIRNSGLHPTVIHPVDRPSTATGRPSRPVFPGAAPLATLCPGRLSRPLHFSPIAVSIFGPAPFESSPGGCIKPPARPVAL